MKRFLTVFFLLIQGSIYAQDGSGMQTYLQKELDKNAAENVGPTPDYSQLFYWAASPYKHDPSDSIPAFLRDEIRDSSADVFYIHPTTYLSDDTTKNVMDAGGDYAKLFAAVKTTSWNANLNSAALNRQTDMLPVLFQASAFNGSCRVFAPRYRQANIKAFFVANSPSAQRAFDLAYEDVKKAFQYYLDHDNHGRPIVIASHSQGSLHAVRLLQDFFDGKPLQKQLVCAYIVGGQIKREAFKYIPACNSPVSTGCVAGWCSYQKGEIPKNVVDQKGDNICVNPLTWTTETSWAPKELSLGSMIDFNTIVMHSTATEIEPLSKILWVVLSDDMPAKAKKMKNLHVYDYNLFWMNIRENVKQRIAAYSNPIPSK